MEAFPPGWKPVWQVVANNNFWHQVGHLYPILFAGTGEGRGTPQVWLCSSSTGSGPSSGGHEAFEMGEGSTWATELLHEKTLAALQAPSPCVTLHCPQHCQPPPCKGKPARWNRSCGTQMSLTELSQADPGASSPEPHGELASTGASPVQGTRQPGTGTVCQKHLCHPTTCCSSEVPWPQLCWMQIRVFPVVWALLSPCCSSLLG